MIIYIHLYANDAFGAKFQDLIEKREKVGLNYYDDPKAFIEYSNDMQDIYKNIEEYNLGKKCQVLIVFEDMIADMINNKKLYPAMNELFIEVENVIFHCSYYTIIF